ncbi:hypothetical protein [Niabella beijingensis]|uniref:hypothetical protein n=1 Tax=Niabella beijingensis TaxID=2872700 RepID=UPI001CBFB450|nr:hypothetical protein [Niabella beijingensis]MBZ4188258.1 hypothetical protein [Niabella beijingensis]
MTRIPFYALLALLFSGACNNPATPPAAVDSTNSQPQVRDTTPGMVQPSDSSGKTGNDSLIVLTVKEPVAQLAADIKKDYQQIHVNVTVSGTKKIKAVLKPEGRERNLRISQIEMPDGKTDGPFGATMEYQTAKKGVYTLIIARNNMAEGEVKGPVQIQVTLE